MDSAPDELRQQLLVDIETGTDNLPDGVGRTIKIHVNKLTKKSDSNGDQTILKEVSLDVPAGMIMGIIGPSGSGKSTLLRALNRLWEPSPGSVFLDGEDICRLDVLSLRRKVGMLFQLPAMFDGTVADNVRFGPHLRGKSLTDAEVLKLLSLSDLDPFLACRPVSELSVGQAQRVAVAARLPITLRPTFSKLQVLLLDEPTSALDPISTQNIEEAIVRLKKTQGMTTIMVSHSVKQMQRIADVVCLLVDGELVEVLEASCLSEAQHPMARRYMELS